MKYSLRSLMRFSLRDLFWVTVVVAMGLAWWVDRSNQERKAQEETAIFWENIKTIAENYAGNEFVITADRRLTPRKLPNSQAPAPNQPKNQSGPHLDP